MAAQSVAEHGISQLRLDEVLSAAGASKSQMYHYFSDRDGLVEAAVSHRCSEVLERLESAFARVASFSDLEAVLSGFAADYARQLTGCPIGTLAAELTDGPEGARRLVTDAFGSWERLLVDALSRIRDNGGLTSEANPAELATGLLAAMEGGMLLGQVREDPGPLRVALAAGLGYIATFRN
ncbi:MAG: TetR/AcrR family transcriptional regulator [Actinomycetota bacterium]|nr:TetR/AcrR family transcriptional regulator [Actinomycetota bacterium]